MQMPQFAWIYFEFTYGLFYWKIVIDRIFMYLLCHGGENLDMLWIFYNNFEIYFD